MLPVDVNCKQSLFTVGGQYKLTVNNCFTLAIATHLLSTEDSTAGATCLL